MKKITMFAVAALACTSFAFAADEAVPQNELQPPVSAQETVKESLPADDAAAVVLPEVPVDEEMMVTPEAAEPEVQLPAEPEVPVDEEMQVTPEATEPEVQLPAEPEAPVDEETPAAPEATEPEVQLPAEPEAPVDEEVLVTPEVTEPEVQLPEEELIIVEIPENEIPVAAAPVTVTVRGVVYDGETIVYDEAETIEVCIGDELDLSAYIWTEVPGIELSCAAETVSVSADATEYVLTYALQEGWVIL